MPVEKDLHFKETAALVTAGVSAGLGSAAKAEQKHVEERHASGQDALGRDWTPLADSTIRQKGHSRLLYERGDLINAYYTQRTGPLSVVLGNSDSKAALHEAGAENLPPRKMLAPAKTHLEHEELMDHLEKSIRQKLALMKFNTMFR